LTAWKITLHGTPQLYRKQILQPRRAQVNHIMSFWIRIFELGEDGLFVSFVIVLNLGFTCAGLLTRPHLAKSALETVIEDASSGKDVEFGDDTIESLQLES
jgi:hypothetical protein